MPFTSIVNVDSKTLLIHILNVGHGDTIIVELPEVDNNRSYIVVDCYLADKTIDYLNNLNVTHLDLVVATHPHSDHYLGLKKLLATYDQQVSQFWDSGFRCNTPTWSELWSYLHEHDEILILRPTAGLEATMSGVDLTVLGPSVNLRTRYDTYGVNINSASLVIKLDYQGKTVILSGDANWDSWAKITEDFPYYQKTVDESLRFQVKKTYNPLNCDVLKVPHHGSINGTSYECIDRLKPNYSVISSNSQHNCPHPIVTQILAEVDTNQISTRDGTVIYTIQESRRVQCFQSNDGAHDVPADNSFNRIPE